MHRALAVDFFVRSLHHQFLHPRSLHPRAFIRDLLSAIRGTGSGGRDLALGDSPFSQETSDASIEVSCLLGDVGRQLRRQLWVAVLGQVLRVSGNRSQRRSQIESHLGRDFAV